MMTRGAALRLVVAPCLVALLVWKIGPRNILLEFRTANAVYFAGGFLTIVFDAFVRSQNWRRMLVALGHPLGATDTFRCYLAGGFLGSALPSTASTDAARGLLARAWFGGSLTDYAASLVSLNILGLLAACSFGVLGALWLLARQQALELGIVVLAVSTGGIALCMSGVLLIRWQRGRERRENPSSLRARAGEFVRRFTSSLLYFETFRRFGIAYAFALLGQLCRVLVLWLVACAVSADIHFWQTVVYGPLIAVVSLMPISVGGFGGEQAAFVLFFSQFGIDPGKAFAVSAATSLLYLCLNLSGSIAYVWMRRLPVKVLKP